jgi:hypothetical protein
MFPVTARRSVNGRRKARPSRNDGSIKCNDRFVGWVERSDTHHFGLGTGLLHCMIGIATTFRAAMGFAALYPSYELPQVVVNQGFQFIDPGSQGAGPSVFYSQPQLPSVYGSMTRPIILPNQGQ